MKYPKFATIKFGRVPSYLEMGRAYPILSYDLHGLEMIRIALDDDKTASCLVNECPHLNDGSWELLSRNPQALPARLGRLTRKEYNQWMSSTDRPRHYDGRIQEECRSYAAYLRTWRRAVRGRLSDLLEITMSLRWASNKRNTRHQQRLAGLKMLSDYARQHKLSREAMVKP